jgi:8-oxo-dGTP pyrophosphatase MutT (NUDIX family)
MLDSGIEETRAERAFIASRLLPLESWRPPEPPPSEHAPAAVLAPLIERPEGLSLLLTVRTRHLRKHAGQIALPGGRSEPGERPWETALREAHEEVGLDPALVDVAGLSDPFWARTGYLITPVVGFVRPDLTLMPNPEEVEDVFEVPFDFIMDAANHQIVMREFADGVSREVLAMPYQDRYIWGMTAMMLRALHARLYGDPPA